MHINVYTYRHICVIDIYTYYTYIYLQVYIFQIDIRNNMLYIVYNMYSIYYG